jgi:hypothetical protein
MEMIQTGGIAMCEERKKAERKRELVREFSAAMATSPTDFDPKHPHPDYCVKAAVINLMAKDRLEALREQAIEHEEQARKTEKKEAAGYGEKILLALIENKPLTIAVAVLIAGDKIIPFLLSYIK